MKIEPNISHGFKTDPIKFQMWKLLLCNFLSQKRGRPYPKGVSKNTAALILKGFQKSGRPYLKGVFEKVAGDGFITLRVHCAKRFSLN